MAKGQRTIGKVADGLDLYGDPLPEGAVVRFGTRRLRHTAYAYSVAISPDDTMLASASRDEPITIWDRPTGKRLYDLREPSFTSIKTVAFSPDSRMIAGGDQTGRVFIWDTTTGALLHELPCKLEVWHLDFSLDGKTLAVSDDESISLWDTKTGVPLPVQGRAASWAVFSPDGRTIASGSKSNRDNLVRIWDVATGDIVRTFEVPKFSSLAFIPDGKALVVGDGNGKIDVLEIGSGKSIAQFQTPGPEHRWDSRIAVSPNGRLIASTGNPYDGEYGTNGTIHIWDLRSGKRHATCLGHPGGVRSLAFSADSKTLVSGGRDCRLRLWNSADGKEIDVVKGHFNPVLAVAFTPDGRTVATGGLDRTVRLWDTKTGEQQRVLRDLKAPVRSICISPDGRLLAAGGSMIFKPVGAKLVCLWDLQTGKVLRAFGEDERDVKSVAFTPDSKTLASVDQRGMLRLWDVASGELVLRIDRLCRDAVMTFSPDGRVLATAGRQPHQIRLWDSETGTKLAEFGQRGDPVSSLSFSPDGKLIAAGHGQKWLHRSRFTGGGQKWVTS
jgi:WD40 repeat protein